MVANWHEEEVLEQMVEGNNKGIQYENHHFFLGIYPNDTTTKNIAEKLSARFKNVHVVVNSKSGPTSKGQMINEIITGIKSLEKESSLFFDLFIIHDSEDIIHPLSMKLFNKESGDLDFMQIPIFSLNRERLQLVAGTYMDEFSETHTKELMVRNAYGASIPSAGVGTCVSRRLVDYIIEQNSGSFLQPDSLTEDYILGLQSHYGGFRCGFVCTQVTDGVFKDDFIATREYFPSGFIQSVKQKTRWTIGIVFQGYCKIGWHSSMLENYFLVRDRRGPLNSILSVSAAITFFIIVFNPTVMEDLLQTNFVYLFYFNSFGLLIRCVQRIRFVGYVYGSYPVLFILIRWPISIAINALASIRALYQYSMSQLGIKKLTWSKTQHSLPKKFGKAS